MHEKMKPREIWYFLVIHNLFQEYWAIHLLSINRFAKSLDLRVVKVNTLAPIGMHFIVHSIDVVMTITVFGNC